MKQVRKYRIKISPSTKAIISRRLYLSQKWQKNRRKSAEFYISTKYLPGQTNEISFALKSSKHNYPASFRLNLILNLSITTASPFLLIIAGMSGIGYFVNQINTVEAINLPGPATSQVVEASKKRPEAEQAYTLPASKPVNLRVPSINLDLDLIEVGQNADKTIETPPLFERIAGWYKLGPTPGELGPAVIVGHVDTYKGPSVFYNINKLKPGDKIEVARADKSKAVFKVTGLDQYFRSNFPTDKVYGNIDHAGLRLITCGGTFDKKSGKYSKNTVVYAKLTRVN